MVTGKVHLFYQGPFSQWHQAPFRDNADDVCFCCCEQYMMYHKAKLFQDEEAMQDILATTEPRKHKSIGRRVQKFDQEIWNAHADEIVYRGNLLKFTQNEHLRQLLLDTGTKLIAEASPRDKIWGIGLSTTDERAQNPKDWQGTNRLGTALVRVRETLYSNKEEANS
eukprot:CAMPEP_0184288656 /NCGR_PEP_ID=MMETSP1049-20130417/1146_1 /TAXON_ID=77928 /ORGANISM="Proteomonas sulcata, Strain CCMP704" /LENGTH=166 /DNA_ID=CAMNT_0026595153 /DNA_START=194 /DNA_END=694 /DNA_ORIENTATION=+